MLPIKRYRLGEKLRYLVRVQNTATLLKNAKDLQIYFGDRFY